MKKLLTIAAVSLLFTACLKNNNNNMNVPAGNLMAFNLAPDQQSVVFGLSGSTLTYSPLSYTSYTGLYQRIYPGSRSVDAYDYPNNTPLASATFNFEQDKYYSTFLIGLNNSYRVAVTNDNFDALSSTTGNAYVRYVNGITDSVNLPAVTISAGGNNVVSENAAYASVSDFKAVPPGNVTINVKSSSSVDSSRTISVEQKKVYTILLAGVPGTTDNAKKVQIRFIENGTLTDSTGKN